MNIWVNVCFTLMYEFYFDVNLLLTIHSIFMTVCFLYVRQWKWSLTAFPVSTFKVFQKNKISRLVTVSCFVSLVVIFLLYSLCFLNISCSTCFTLITNVLLVPLLLHNLHQTQRLPTGSVCHTGRGVHIIQRECILHI